MNRYCAHVGFSSSLSNFSCWRRLARSDQLSIRVQQWHAVTRQDPLHLALMRADPLVERVFPLFFAEAHAHRDFEVELDRAIRLEGQRAPRRALCMPAREETRDRPPHDRHVDLAGRQVALDRECRAFRRIAALRRVEDGVIEQVIAQQPIRAGRTAEDADAQGLPLLRRQREQILRRLQSREFLARLEYQRVGGTHVRPRGRRELEALRHADDHVAFELLGRLVTLSQGIAHESHALRKERELDAAPEVAGQRLRDLVFVPFGLAVRERHVAGVCADSQHGPGVLRVRREQQARQADASEQRGRLSGATRTIRSATNARVESHHRLGPSGRRTGLPSSA